MFVYIFFGRLSFLILVSKILLMDFFVEDHMDPWGSCCTSLHSMLFTWCTNLIPIFLCDPHYDTCHALHLQMIFVWLRMNPVMFYVKTPIASTGHAQLHYMIPCEEGSFLLRLAWCEEVDMPVEVPKMLVSLWGQIVKWDWRSWRSFELCSQWFVSSIAHCAAAAAAAALPLSRSPTAISGEL